MCNVFVPVKFGVASTPEGTLRRVLQQRRSTELPMHRFGAVILQVMPSLFLCGLDSFGSAAEL